MSIHSVSGSTAHIAAATQTAKPQSISALQNAKQKAPPAVAAAADSDGDHDGSGGGGRINVKA